MSKMYIISFSLEYNREAITALLDKDNRFFWFYSIPNSVFVKTTASAQEIYEFLTPSLGKHRIFIGEVGGNYYGLLPKDHWKYFGK